MGSQGSPRIAALENLCTFLNWVAFQSSIMKRTSFLSVSSGGLEGLHRTVQLQLLQHYWLGHAAAAAKSLQSCPTLCDPVDGSPPGSPVPGILQARTLEWIAISFSNA